MNFTRSQNTVAFAVLGVMATMFGIGIGANMHHDETKVITFEQLVQAESFCNENGNKFHLELDLMQDTVNVVCENGATFFAVEGKKELSKELKQCPH